MQRSAPPPSLVRGMDDAAPTADEWLAVESAATPEVVASSQWFGSATTMCAVYPRTSSLTITIEDERGAQDTLTSNVASPEEKLGRKWQRINVRH